MGGQLFIQWEVCFNLIINRYGFILFIIKTNAGYYCIGSWFGVVLNKYSGFNIKAAISNTGYFLTNN